MIKIIIIEKKDPAMLKACEEIGHLSLPIFYSYNDFINLLNLEKEITIYGGLIENKNDIVAFAVTTKILDRIHILSIACHPNYRRKNIGSSLINSIKKQNKNITLYVQCTNINAIDFYEKNSFIKHKREVGYYQNLKDKDAYLMLYINKE